MSTLTMYYVAANGNVTPYEEFRNAHGGAMFLWRRLSLAFLDREYAFLSKDGNELWDLVNDGRLENFEKSALASTFDFHILAPDRIPILIDAYQRFLRKYPAAPTEVCHLPGIIAALQRISIECPDFRGVCFQWTSCAMTFWRVRNADDETDLRYNIDTDTEHVWL